MNRATEMFNRQVAKVRRAQLGQRAVMLLAAFSMLITLGFAGVTTASAAPAPIGVAPVQGRAISISTQGVAVAKLSALTGHVQVTASAIRMHTSVAIGTTKSTVQKILANFSFSFSSFLVNGSGSTCTGTTQTVHVTTINGVSSGTVVCS